MEEYVYVDGKKYKRGYTTGTCAAAATKASLISFITGKKLKSIEIDVPKGICISIEVENQEILKEYVLTSVKKDGGDDIDSTHGIDVLSKVEIINSDKLPENRCKSELDYVEITSGEGVGLVTKKGLSVEVGRPAINPVPIKMICSEIEKAIDEYDIDINRFLYGRKILVTITVPKGKEISLKTFNRNLGIVDGISIIGTTGIVEPMSDDGWKKALSAELSIKKEEALNEIILVPGNIGFKNMVEKYGYDENKILKIGNFIGYILMECKRFGFKKIIIAGHLGKLIKLSAGIMNTHSRVADARTEIMISNLALMGAEKDFLDEINSCITTDAMIPIIYEKGYEDVFDILAQKATDRAKKYMRNDENNIDIEVFLFSMDGNLLARKVSENRDI